MKKARKEDEVSEAEAKVMEIKEHQSLIKCTTTMHYLNKR